MHSTQPHPLDGACVDVLPPEGPTVDLPEGALALVVVTSKRWEPGRTLDVHYMNGNDAQKAVVRAAAAKWSAVANILFRHDAPAQGAELRVKFDPTLGNWSYLGLDNLNIPQGQQTLNLTNVDEGTALHELGHALGSAHEHSSPAGTINWNKPVVYAALGGPPNNWDRAKVDHNVFFKYSGTVTQYSKFDPKSVMLYFFPADWTLDGKGTSSNDTLSAMDTAFMNAMYPGCTVDFSLPTPNTGNATFSTGPSTAYNAAYGRSWTMRSPGNSFIEVRFHQPKNRPDGTPIFNEARLRLVHLTSMLKGAAGYSPIDVVVNGKVIKADYSPNPANGGYTDESIDILDALADGANTIRLNFKRGARSVYWIKHLSVDTNRLNV